MQRRFVFSLIACLPIALSHAFSCPAAEATYQLKVVTNRPNALYSAGETVEFRVTLTSEGTPVQEGEVSYVLDNDEMPPVTRGKAKIAQGTATVRGTLAAPGFLRCRVWYGAGGKGSVSSLAAAGIDPLKIRPSLPVPDDFDAFWDEQKRKLRAIPLAPVLTPVKSPVAGIECFDVQTPCLGGRPVSGYFARPVGAKPKSLPAVLHVQGAGVRGSMLGAAIGGAQTGMLSMDINAHGIPNGRPDGFYDELSRNELGNYPGRGVKDRQTCYFLGMFLRLVRAIDFLCSQPEWNGTVLMVEGHSQGGGQAIAAAGLDPRVTFIAAGVPAICDHTGRAVGRINGWPKLVPNDADGKPDPTALQVARYFDAMNFAGRAKADAIFSVGFIDGVCPATSVYAAYNNLPGVKQMLIEPLMGHAAPPNICTAFQKAISDHASRKTHALK